MISLSELRLIVTTNMPYDTGYMFLAGSRYFENEHYMLCKYDTERVPYIIYNEEGTVFSVKNRGFIARRTMGEINYIIQMRKAGGHTSLSGLTEIAKRRGSTNMIKQGAMDKISNDFESGIYRKNTLESLQR